MKTISGVLIIILGIITLVYIPLVWMLYGGIMQAIENWGVNNSAVVWGVIKAVMCEVGILPGWLLIIIGMVIVKD